MKWQYVFVSVLCLDVDLQLSPLFLSSSQLIPDVDSGMYAVTLTSV